MRSLVRLSIPLFALSATVASAAEVPKKSEPIATISVSDGAALTQHANDSLYGRLWADASLAPLHPLLDSALAHAQQQAGCDLLAVITASRSVSLRMVGITALEGKPTPVVVVQADLGESANRIFTLLKPDDWTATNVPGSDEAVGTEDGSLRIARFGHDLRMGFNSEDLPSWRADAGTADVAMRLDVPRLMAALVPTLPPEIAAGAMGTHFEWLRQHVGVITSETRLTAEGMEDRMTAAMPRDGLLDVDRLALARVPANALTCTAVGLDGAAWWRTYGDFVLDLAASADRTHPDARAIERRVDAALAAAGFPRVSELVGGVTGTQLLFITPGSPMPAYSLVLRRSPAIDRAVTAVLTLIGQAPPAEGEAMMISIPRMPMLPVVPQLALDHDTWLLTTDPLLASEWATATGGWAESPTGAAALAHAGEHAFLISGSDTTGMVRMVLGYASIVINSARNLEPGQRRAILQGLDRLATIAKPGYAVGRATATGVDIEIHSLFGSSAQLAVAAAIAIPNLLTSRAASEEAAAASTLRSAILPAEVQFQAGAYVDLDGNGIGEYGFPSEMTGAHEVSGVTLNLLAPQFTDLTVPIAGYRYAVHLPDGAGGAIGSADQRPADPLLSKDRERRWLAYAWPVDRAHGKRMLAIDQSGAVYAAPFSGAEPEWNALYGGKGWTDPPTWQLYENRRRRHHAADPAAAPPADPPAAGRNEF